MTPWSRWLTCSVVLSFLGTVLRSAYRRRYSIIERFGFVSVITGQVPETQVSPTLFSCYRTTLGVSRPSISWCSVLPTCPGRVWKPDDRRAAGSNCTYNPIPLLRALPKLGFALVGCTCNGSTSTALAKRRHGINAGRLASSQGPMRSLLPCWPCTVIYLANTSLVSSQYCALPSSSCSFNSPRMGQV